MILYGKNKITEVKSDSTKISLSEIGETDVYTTETTSLTVTPNVLDEFEIGETKKVIVETNADIFKVSSSDPDTFECIKTSNCSCDITNKQYGVASITISAKKNDHSEASIKLSAKALMKPTVLELNTLDVINIEKGAEGQFSVTTNAEEINAISGNPKLLKVNTSNKIVYLTGLKAGSTDITVTAQALNHLETSKTVSVNIYSNEETDPEIPVDPGEGEDGSDNGTGNQPGTGGDGQLPDTILELDTLELITIEQGVDASFAVTTNADKISANAEDTTIVSVSVIDKIIKLIALKPGSTTVIVSAHAVDSNPVSKTVNVNVTEKPNLPENGGSDSDGDSDGESGEGPGETDPDIPNIDEIDPDFSVDHEDTESGGEEQPEETETELTISPSDTLELKVEEETTIIATTNATSITAESDSEHVEVQVEDKTITVLGISVGSANITVKAKAENHKEKLVSITCNVTEKEELPLPETDLSVEPSSLSITEGKEGTITATTSADSINAESDSQEHATVRVESKNVIVTGVKQGSANITIRATATNHTEKAIIVPCTINAKPETSLTIEPTSLVMIEEESKEVIATTNADIIEAVSDNDSVATASVQGKTITVRGISVGNTIIRVSAEETDHSKTTVELSCEVKEKVIPQTSLTANPNTVTVKETEDATIIIETNADTITAESNSEEHATVSVQEKTVTVTGVKAGSAEITVKATAAEHTENSITIPCTIEEKPKPPTELTLSSESGEVFENETVQITATTNADTITAESNNTSHATVEVSDKTITIRGVAEGSANINVKATAEDSLETTKTYTCTVNKKPATDLELDSYSGTFEVDTIVEVTATTSADTITAESNNTDYAMVEVTGKTVKITGTGAGNATISIKAQADGKTETIKTYEATITPSSKPATTITLNPQDNVTTISASEELQISASSNASSSTLKYYSSDEEVLKVLTEKCWSNFIYVQGLKPGKAILHVSAQATNSAIGRAKLEITVTEDLGVGLPANHVFRYYGALPNAGTGQSFTTYITESEGVIEATSENPSIAYPNITKGKNMAIQGVAKGNTVINGTITAPNRTPRTFKIYISTLEDYESQFDLPELSLTLNEKTVSIPAGQEKEITFTTNGSYINAESLKSATCEARVEGNKVIIKANNPGTTKVYVFSNKERSQEASDYITVTVTPIE